MELFVYLAVAAIPGVGAGLLATQWLTPAASTGLGILVGFSLLCWGMRGTKKPDSDDSQHK